MRAAIPAILLIGWSAANGELWTGGAMNLNAGSRVRLWIDWWKAMGAKELRESARGEECTLRLYPHCNGNPETVVLCHLPSNAGMARKSPDWWGVYGCSSCHDVIDGRGRTDIPPAEVERSKLRALYETQTRMRDKGLIR